MPSKRPHRGLYRTPIRIVEALASTPQSGNTVVTERDVIMGKAYVEDVKPDAPRDGGSAEPLTKTTVRATMRMRSSTIALISTKFQAIISDFRYEIQKILPARYNDTVVLTLSRLGGGEMAVTTPIIALDANGAIPLVTNTGRFLEARLS